MTDFVIARLNLRASDYGLDVGPISDKGPPRYYLISFAAGNVTGA